MKMFKSRELRRSLLIAVTLAIVVIILCLWDHFREELRSGEDREEAYQEEESGSQKAKSSGGTYRVVLEDSAQLLDESEEEELAVLMQEVTAYGNAAFKTTDQNAGSTEAYARQYYREQFGTDSGILFLIDMDNRTIWIHSDGAVYRVITKSYADTITDNVYRYATDGEYYRCGAEAFTQITELLEGNRIAQPMKYISNALLAVIMALLLNYGLVSVFARMRKPGRRELLGYRGNYFRYTTPQAFFTGESKSYHPTSSGGSGSSRSGGSSGGSSGRSSSGGGGGHRF